MKSVNLCLIITEFLIIAGTASFIILVRKSHSQPSERHNIPVCLLGDNWKIKIHVASDVSNKKWWRVRQR